MIWASFNVPRRDLELVNGRASPVRYNFPRRTKRYVGPSGGVDLFQQDQINTGVTAGLALETCTWKIEFDRPLGQGTQFASLTAVYGGGRT